MIIGQTELRPGTVLEVLVDLADRNVTRVRLAVAYITRAGSDLLIPRLAARIGVHKWRDAEKVVVTCFDFGMTEPEALRSLSGAGFEVRIAQPDVLDTPGLRPTVAFHPKLYILDTRTSTRLLVGSSNMSDRALTANTEAAAILVSSARESRREVESVWQWLTEGAVALDAPLLDAYITARRSLKLPRPARRKGAPPTSQPPEEADIPEEPLNEAVLVGPSAGVQTFAAALTAGVDPENYDNFWVQAVELSGGSHNQLELPRHGSQFFNFHHPSYGPTPEPIGPLTLVAGSQTWTDRRLRWHADNGMERLNLPTLAQGGFTYENSAVLFRRATGGFELEVAPWASPLVVSWRNASEKLGLVFPLGAGSDRLCGLF